MTSPDQVDDDRKVEIYNQMQTVEDAKFLSQQYGLDEQVIVTIYYQLLNQKTKD